MTDEFTRTDFYSDKDSTHDSDRETSNLLDENRTLPLNQSWRSHRWLKWSVIGLLFFLPGFITIFFRLTTDLVVAKRFDSRDYGDCGNTVEEARARQCIFDNLSYSWHRPECVYPELVARYHERVNLTYYSHHSLEARYLLPREEVMQGMHSDTWTSTAQHMVHCAFILEKIHRAYDTNGPLDSQARSLHHTHHCTEILLDDLLHEVPCEQPPCQRVTHARARFTSCKRP